MSIYNEQKHQARALLINNFFRKPRISAAISLAVIFSSMHLQAQEFDLNIPALPLASAVNELGKQTRLQILYNPNDLQGLRSTALDGRLEPADAIALLLQDTNITYSIEGSNITLRSRRSDEANTSSEKNAVELAPMTIQGGILGDLSTPYSGGQLASGGSLGLLGAEDVMDTPFSTTNYTSELLYDQQARTLSDVVVNDASVRTTTSTGGFGEDFQIRGFAVGSGDVSVNGLYGLVSSSRVPIQIMDRVEVLKGPGTLMRGIPPGGSVGGAINIVTKRALDEPLTRITAGYTSQSNATAQLDLGRRFGQNNAWGMRFNGVLRGGEATIKDGDQKLGMGALGLDYRGDRLRWSLDAIYQEDELEDFRTQIGFTDSVTKLPSAPDGRDNFYPNTKLTQRDSTLMSRLEYDFSDSLTGHIGMGYRDGEVRQIFPVTTGTDADGDFNVISTFYDSYSKTFSSDAGIKAYFSTGMIDHKLAIGSTFTAQENGNAYSPGSISVPSNIYNPVPLPLGPDIRLTPKRASDTELSSFAIADTLSFAQDRVLLTLGARHQTVEVDSYSTATGAKTQNYRSNAISPVAGVVFKPVDNISLYANYTSGLSKGTVVGETYTNRGQVLAPFKSKQYEAGVKVDWGTITTTAALYQIARPAGYADESNTYGYFGEQRNRGLELSAYGELQPGLRLMTSAALIDSELTKTAKGANQGNRPAGVPRHTLNLGLDWDTPWVEGLSLNGRAINTSALYIDNANVRRLPSVTRFDVGARYGIDLHGKSVVFRANVENVANKRYWLAAGTYATNAAGRTVMLSSSVNF